ncbi:hypothetical protein ACW9KT_19395 [Hymenobacter sp. HD11105]
MAANARMRWTEEQVLDLIVFRPDQERMLELAAPGCWSALGQADSLGWGRGQQGEESWQAGLDFTDSKTRFACSCPDSFPHCVHSVALLLLWVRMPQQFPVAPRPAAVRWWAAARAVDAAWQGAPTWYVYYHQAQHALEEPEEPLLLQRQQQGATALARWLRALIGEGLVHARYLFRSLWQNQVAALLEHDLPGLAIALRRLEKLRHAGEPAQGPLLAALGELYLLTQAFRQRAELPALLQQDVRQLAGYDQLARESVLALEPAVPDTWVMLAQRTWQETRFSPWHHRRTWFWGPQSGRYALVVKRYFNYPEPSTTFQAQGQYAGNLHFYPSAYPLRAVPGNEGTFLPPQPAHLPGGISPQQLTQGYAAALAQQPWLPEWPVTLTRVVPVLTAPDQLQLYHPGEQVLVPVRGADHEEWQLLATGGGAAITVFGEWNGHALLPLASWASTPPPVTPR